MYECKVEVTNLRKLQRKQLITINIYKKILQDFYNQYFFCNESLFFKQVYTNIQTLNIYEPSFESTYAKLILFPKKDITTTYVQNLFHMLTAIGIKFSSLKKVLQYVCDFYNFDLVFSDKMSKQLAITVGYQKIYIN